MSGRSVHLHGFARDGRGVANRAWRVVNCTDLQSSLLSHFFQSLPETSQLARIALRGRPELNIRSGMDMGWSTTPEDSIVRFFREEDTGKRYDQMVEEIAVWNGFVDATRSHRKTTDRSCARLFDARHAPTSF